MTYFGLQEEQKLTMELFEWTFENKLRFFNVTIEQRSTRSSNRTLSDSVMDNVKLLTTYEWDFYAYAKRLFHERVEFMHLHQGEIP